MIEHPVSAFHLQAHPTYPRKLLVVRHSSVASGGMSREVQDHVQARKQEKLETAPS